MKIDQERISKINNVTHQILEAKDDLSLYDVLKQINQDFSYQYVQPDRRFVLIGLADFGPFSNLDEVKFFLIHNIISYLMF